MALRRWLTIGSLGLAVALSASANSIIRDPAMDVVEDVLSDPVSGGIHFTATDNGGGIFGFFNDTGQLITALTFITTAAPNLPQETIDVAFVCGSGGRVPNPFFLNCSIDYDPEDGRLTISFFGVNRPDDDEQVGEAGDQEGIGPVFRRIIACDGICPAFDPNIGHFAVNLNDGGVGGDRGGWNDPDLFPNGPAGFTGEAVFAPEPGTVALMAGALAGLAVVRRRRRR
jgi:hypothetical protein